MCQTDAATRLDEMEFKLAGGITGLEVNQIKILRVHISEGEPEVRAGGAGVRFRKLNGESEIIDHQTLEQGKARAVRPVGRSRWRGKGTQPPAARSNLGWGISYGGRWSGHAETYLRIAT